MPLSSSAFTHLLLPSSIRGMTRWDPGKLKSLYSVPSLHIPLSAKISCIFKELKPFLLKRPNFKPVDEERDRKVIYVNPSSFCEAKTVIDSMEIPDLEWRSRDIALTVDNWRPDEILRAVLPEEEEGFSSFSVVGHIAHVNLRDHLLPFKFVIGEILLLHKRITSVIRKTDSIENTFRNFSMEVIAGEKDHFEVEVKESGCRYRFDFSKVYWNPRLSSEHERVSQLITSKDLVADVFAGVGPFVVPIGLKKKPKLIIANDLNPESFKYLNLNKDLNKIKGEFKSYNLDGREFIKTVVKDEILKFDGQDGGSINVIMNLPAIAIEFLDVFPGLLYPEKYLRQEFPSVKVFAYCFSNEDDREGDIRRRVLGALKEYKPSDIKIDFVRSVSRTKDMFRVSLTLDEGVLLSPPVKKAKAES